MPKRALPKRLGPLAPFAVNADEAVIAFRSALNDSSLSKEARGQLWQYYIDRWQNLTDRPSK
jgi:hypothetical protein